MFDAGGIRIGYMLGSASMLVTAPLPSTETIHGLQMMGVISAESGWLVGIVARYGAQLQRRWALGYDGTQGWNRAGNWT